ncbi:hypothetical protein KP509_22G029300 [Ceratopteris richardii]|uniref:Uncharacterized protein n=1 Tax=Ceratopteris richardii TaxID=49495 RepID=A0A8T2S3S3_CERRI|nr:hypothetical protein KP509_22G029300 [Ceratopteris richardii]
MEKWQLCMGKLIRREKEGSFFMFLVLSLLRKRGGLPETIRRKFSSQGRGDIDMRKGEFAWQSGSYEFAGQAHPSGKGRVIFHVFSTLFAQKRRGAARKY